MVKYIGKGTFQCWSCKNQEGVDQGWKWSFWKYSEVQVKETVEFPECRVTGLSMHEVYDIPCKHYEKRENSEEWTEKLMKKHTTS